MIIYYNELMVVLWCIRATGDPEKYSFLGTMFLFAIASQENILILTGQAETLNSSILNFELTLSHIIFKLH